MICKALLDPRALDIDHIRSLHDGGKNSPDNLQALCKNCHGLKTFEELHNTCEYPQLRRIRAGFPNATDVKGDIRTCDTFIICSQTSKATNKIAVTFQI